MGVKLLQLAYTPEQQLKVCSWEWNSHQRWSDVSSVYLPLLLYLLQLANVLWPVSCIKIQMWKTLPVSSLNFFCCCWGEEGGWVFPFPFSFLFIVECIKWSKANFRLTKFKNYFLCSDVFVWKVIPVCARQEMRIRSLVHTLGFWAEELRCAGRPECFWEKRRKTARPPSASKGSRLSCHGFGVTLWSGWLGRHPWLN